MAANFSFYRLLVALALRETMAPLKVNVQLDQGLLQGVELTSVEDNRSYVGFLGIPYAKPPIGELRFKGPQPPEPWDGTLYATRHAAQCVQKFPYSFHPTIEGSEDCLFLNVYTPKVPYDAEQKNNLLPVMVWIHGGGFEIGSGDMKLYGPDYLIVQDVVIVTFNYRLGVLGFLSFEDSTVPGNAGMKDQVAALRWVKHNIARFGGNPDDVTIFGESAGGVSVQYHLISPMSKGLFHKAISQSGSVLNPWSFTTVAKKRAVLLAETFGCNSTVTDERVACLRNVEAYKLVELSHRHTLSEEDERHGTKIPFVPSSEKAIVSDEEAFLLDHPSTSLSTGSFHQVPQIIGGNSHEAILFTPAYKSEGFLSSFEDDLQRLVPQELSTAQNDNETEELARRIKTFYFGNDSVTKETIPQLVNLLTDVFFTNGVRQAMMIEANYSSSPIYFYQFSFNGILGFMKRLMHANKLPGACHADDLGYLFRIAFWARVLSPDSPEVKTRHRMVKMWTNFAKTGNPSSDLDAILNVTWTPVSATNENVLIIDQELTMHDKLEPERMAFWDELRREQQKKIT